MFSDEVLRAQAGLTLLDHLLGERGDLVERRNIEFLGQFGIAPADFVERSQHEPQIGLLEIKGDRVPVVLAAGLADDLGLTLIDGKKVDVTETMQLKPGIPQTTSTFQGTSEGDAWLAGLQLNYLF